MQRKNKKKQESFDEVWKKNVTIKDENALFSHHNNHGKVMKYIVCNTNRGRENNDQERQQTYEQFS